MTPEITNKLTFVNPKDDIIFRKIFGSENHTEPLLEFLNQVLEREAPILEVEIMNPFQFQLPRTRGLKLTALDIKARDKHHEFLIEMQVEKKKWFREPVLHDICKAYASQLKEGENYDGLRPIVFLGVLNFCDFEGNNVFTRHQNCNQKTENIDFGQLELNFIELPNFNKKESELTTLADQWLFFLKNAELLDHIPESTTSPHVREAYQSLNHHSWTPDELEAYGYWMRKEHASENSIETARLEAKAEAEAKTKAEEEASLVRKMLTNGANPLTIHELTGLSLAEIAKIKDAC